MVYYRAGKIDRKHRKNIKVREVTSAIFVKEALTVMYEGRYNSGLRQIQTRFKTEFYDRTCFKFTRVYTTLRTLLK